MSAISNTTEPFGLTIRLVRGTNVSEANGSWPSRVKRRVVICMGGHYFGIGTLWTTIVGIWRGLGESRTRGGLGFGLAGGDTTRFTGAVTRRGQ